MDQGNVVNLYSGILFSYLKTRTLPGLVAHTFNPSTWEAEVPFNPSLVYRVSSRTARAIQRNPILNPPQKIPPKMGDIMKFTGKWMEIKNVILNEVT